eukprot:5053494-Heterocapsa_arctica.AAC.1
MSPGTVLSAELMMRPMIQPTSTWPGRRSTAAAAFRMPARDPRSSCCLSSFALGRVPRRFSEKTTLPRPSPPIAGRHVDPRSNGCMTKLL